MASPSITISLQKITHNAAKLCRLCAEHGVGITGVSKGVWGNPDIAQAMLDGGVESIAESRLGNISRLRAAGINCPLWLLRLPALSEVDQVVTSVDLSLNSELSVISALSDAALQQEKKHAIILMVDLGDLREGILPEELLSTVKKILSFSGVELMGLGTNLSCYGGVVPTAENLGRLVLCAEKVEAQFGFELQYLSGGNSSSLPLLLAGKMPARINHLRLGESILLGRETITRSAFEGTCQDAFLLEAEIIEKKKKGSVPMGKIGEDAFGNTPVFIEKGEMMRVIVNLGRGDVNIDGIQPIEPNVQILGASSDHLLLDVTTAETTLAVGDRLQFSMNYSALLAAMHSASVTQCFHRLQCGDEK